MTEDFFFRAAFLAILIFAVVSRAMQKHQPDGTKNERREARERDGFVSVSLRILYPFWVAAMWLYPFGFSWFQRFEFYLPLWARISGIALAVASLVLFWQAHRALGVYFSTELKLLSEHMLVDKGPYRWIRHPMYTVIILLTVSTILISTNLLVAIPNVVLTIIICLRIPREEKMLLERFGESYREYQQKTGKLFPRIIR